MRKKSFLTVIISFLIILPFGAESQNIVPASADEVWLAQIGVYDPNGTWDYVSTHEWTSCSGGTGERDTGTATISGSDVTYVASGGATMTGTITGSGPNYTITGSFPSGTGTIEFTADWTMTSPTTATKTWTWTWTDGVTSCNGGGDFAYTRRASTITASAETGGTISPSGSVTVNTDADQTFTIAPNAGYSLLDVKVDGSSVGAVTSYTFTNVQSNHSIVAIFGVIKAMSWLSLLLD